MGLDTTHECWHGAYGAFARWRCELARAAGYEIVTAGLGSPGYDLPWHEFGDKNYEGEWDGPPPGNDALLYLLAHSDCDGVIHPEQGTLIAQRLEQLMPLLHESAREATQRFISGLRIAAAAGEDVEFR